MTAWKYWAGDLRIQQVPGRRHRSPGGRNGAPDPYADRWQTPPSAAALIIPFLPPGSIDSGSRQRRWTTARKPSSAAGLEAYGTDILTGTDFLTAAPPYSDTTMIVTNPPYSTECGASSRAALRSTAALAGGAVWIAADRMTIGRDHVPDRRYRVATGASSGLVWFTWRSSASADVAASPSPDDSTVGVHGGIMTTPISTERSSADFSWQTAGELVGRSHAASVVGSDALWAARTVLALDVADRDGHGDHRRQNARPIVNYGAASRYMDEDDDAAREDSAVDKARRAAVTVIVKRLTIDVCRSMRKSVRSAGGRSRPASDRALLQRALPAAIALAREAGAEGVDPRRYAIVRSLRSNVHAHPSQSALLWPRLQAGSGKEAPAQASARPRPCARCGALFTPRPDDPHRSTARMRCGWRMRAARRPKAEVPTVDCAHCGGVFRPTQPTQRFCSIACRQAAWIEAHPRPKRERTYILRKPVYRPKAVGSVRYHRADHLSDLRRPGSFRRRATQRYCSAACAGPARTDSLLDGLEPWDRLLVGICRQALEDARRGMDDAVQVLSLDRP